MCMGHGAWKHACCRQPGKELEEKRRNVQTQLSFTEQGARYCARHLTPHASLRLVMEAGAPNPASQSESFSQELKPPDTQKQS